MKTKLLFTFAFIAAAFTLHAQCHFIPSTSTATDTLSYSFSGGSFQSYGCAPIDPNYWISGSGTSVTVTFVNPEAYPSVRVWGMNDDDSAAILVNSVSYPLNSSTASYTPKVVCGTSPGPDGVIFANGKLVGANTNSEGNYSYQDIMIGATSVNTITINGISGAGWGFAGILTDCNNAVSSTTPNSGIRVFPNPSTGTTTITSNKMLENAVLTIYNPLGQSIEVFSAISGSGITFSTANFAKGIYIAELMENGNLLAKEKLIVE
jgi:hypothetical protein